MAPTASWTDKVNQAAGDYANANDLKGHERELAIEAFKAGADKAVVWGDKRDKSDRPST